MARTTDGRLAYADLLRAAAILAVIVLNLSAGALGKAGVSTASWTALNAYAALSRWCAPMFVMLSGAFLLEPKKSERWPVLGLRILRILVALVVWGAFYALLDHAAAGGKLTWPGVRAALYAAARGDIHHHLLFLYVILGLYLLTPILRAFVRGASRGDLHYFFLLTFLVAILLPTALQLSPSPVLSRYLERLDIHLVLGYVGYFVAGYYLKTYTIGRIAEALIYVFGVAGAVVTVWGTAVLSRPAGQLNDILYGYMTPNVCATAVAVFVLFRYVLGLSDERDRRRRMAGVGKIALGIYLVHDAFVMLLRWLNITPLSFTPALSVPLLAAAIFLLSFAVAWLLSKLPFVGPYLT